MKGDFRLVIETMHAPDNGSQENAHELKPDLLKQREVVHIDIANDNLGGVILQFSSTVKNIDLLLPGLQTRRRS